MYTRTLEMNQDQRLTMLVSATSLLDRAYAALRVEKRQMESLEIMREINTMKDLISFWREEIILNERESAS